MNLREFLNEALDMRSDEEKLEAVLKRIKAKYSKGDVETLVISEVGKMKVPGSAKRSPQYTSEKDWFQNTAKPQAVNKILVKLINDAQSESKTQISYNLRNKIFNKLEDHYDQKGA